MVKPRGIIALVRAGVLCLVLVMGGCTSMPRDPSVTPTDPVQPSPTVAGQPIASLKRAGFARVATEQVAVAPRIPAYNPNPEAAVNAELVQELAPETEAFLAEHGFVITADGSATQIDQIYAQAKERGVPVFVTVDALLHTYHVLYDYTLRSVEYDYLVHDLEALLRAMSDATQEQLAAARAEPVREAAQRNLAFLAVAARLLDPASHPPEAVRPLVEAELALIDAHAGLARSPLLDYDEDYSQYVPRGHYTRNETFERYFRAMMWLGRIAFRLRPGDSPEELAAGRRETRQAILLVAALQHARADDQTALALWERIYEPTAFFVGETDDLNVYDYSQVMSETFGERLDLAALADDAAVDAFIARAAASRPPRIVSTAVDDQSSPLVTQGWRFMGQRFVPDSYMFQELVYNRVGTYQSQGQPFTLEDSAAGPIRAMPRGLDVAAVLGSERALAILSAEGDTAYEGYDEQMARLRDEFGALPEAQWTQNLYWHWLHMLRPLLSPKGAGYPLFMQDPAWQDKSLNAFLGSWAELRHDTILYAKQSYTMKATGMRPEPEHLTGYVEPDVELWGRMLALVRQMRVGLQARGLLSDEFTTRLNEMETLVVSLREIARKELAAEPLSASETATIEGIGNKLASLTTFSEEVEGKITSQADERMAIVADVHTDVNSGQVLEEGVGDPLRIYVLVPQGDKTVLTVGGVFSHYEFKQPMAQRLTDEAWQTMSPRPALAPWMEDLVRE